MCSEIVGDYSGASNQRLKVLRRSTLLVRCQANKMEIENMQEWVELHMRLGLQEENFMVDSRTDYKYQYTEITPTTAALKGWEHPVMAN